MVRRKLVLSVLALIFTVGASRCDLSAAEIRGQWAADLLRPLPVSTHVEATLRYAASGLVAIRANAREQARARHEAMQISPYLSFNGQCEEAFTFYAECLGGQLGGIFRYEGSPQADHVPADWQDKVMHGSVTVGDQVLMGGDVAPDRYERPTGFTLSIQITSTAEAERIFHELSQDGRVSLPLEQTFWAARFGMLVDRFGIPWQINCEGSERPLDA